MRALLEGRALVREFMPRRSLLRPRPAPVRAVDGVDVVLREGESVGIVGESGSGKSTLVRLLMGLIAPTEGVVRFRGEELRREVQLVFQDAAGALNPRHSVSRIVSEPLVIHGIGSRAERRRRVDDVLRRVALDPGCASLRPHELSGGQRQRVGIARALAMRPRALILDEPVSALDLPVQARIANLLTEMRDDHGVALLIVAHDLTLVRHLCGRVLVLQDGRVVEEGPVARVYGEPRHPHTKALLRATPVLITR